MRSIPSAAGPQGVYAATPRGVILHGSRSGQAAYDTAKEMEVTDAWAANPANAYGWQCTIGDDVVSIHLGESNWGWNAFQASEVYLAVEFAQATEAHPISDAQVRAFCWWYAKKARATWPALSLHMPTHSEVEASGEIQHSPSGKTDVFSLHSPAADELRSRILARLKSEYGIVP